MLFFKSFIELLILALSDGKKGNIDHEKQYFSTNLACE